MPQINKPNEYFNTKLYTGNSTGSTEQSITGLGFSPDMVWIKSRTDAEKHSIADTVRGATKTIHPHLTDAEETSAGHMVSFDSDGYTVGVDNFSWNKSGSNYASWCWKAGGTASSNTDGSITSQVSANTTSGFSVGKTTGTLSSGTITVGHGLGTSNIGMVLWKRTDGVSNWQVYHKSTGVNLTQLNTTGAVTSGTNYWGTPTSTTFTVENSLYGAGETYVYYCFADKKGFSKAFSYTGNGSADGSFVYLGFRPAFIMLRRSNTTGNWIMLDNKRDTYNLATTYLLASQNNAEATGISFDFLSNGLKLRASGQNESGDTYIGIAFAENPLVGTNNIPATAK